MDKKLLDALNNLADALDYLTESMKETKKDKDKSPTAEALTSNAKLEKKIDALNKGVIEVQNDNKKIIKNQEELLKIAKEQKAAQETGGPVGEASDPKKKNKIKDGLTTIMMIAVGVLAIGLAFKLVGSLNFVSVIALALALPLVAIAFERIAQMEDLKPSKIGDVILVILAIVTAITVSSWILSLVAPISLPKLITIVLIGAAFAAISPYLPKLLKEFEEVTLEGALKFAIFGTLTLLAVSVAITISSWVLQSVMPVGFVKLFTVIMIAAAFTVVAMGLPRMLEAFNKVSVGGAAKMILFGPLVLLVISTAIMLSSYVLQLVKPVGIAKLFTAVLIAAAFAVLAYSLPKILNAFNNVKMPPEEAAGLAILMPIVFLGLAAAIVGASWLFQMIKPVSLIQIFTAFLIGIVFIPLSFALPFLAKAMQKITIDQAMLMPVVLVLLAGAIMLSSYLFNLTQPVPFMRLLNIIVQAITLSVIGIALSIAIMFVSKVKEKDAVKGGVVLVIMALVIMVSSLILNLGTYANYPTFGWILGVGAALLAFTIATVALGIVVSVATPAIMLIGAVAILGLSLVIVGTSLILGMGKYETGTFPNAEWAITVAGTIGAFGILAAATGLLFPLIALGSLSIFLLSYVIKAVAEIFTEAEFVNYPSVEWSLGVIGTIGGFGALAVGMAMVGLLSLVGIPVMFAIAYTIVEISDILSEGNYNLPGIAIWSASIALLYTVFTPILLVLAAVAVANAVVSAFGANPMEMARDMIINIAETIVEVADVLSKGTFTGGPTVDWASGVAIALGAFSPIYKMLVMNKIFEAFGGGVGPDEFNQAIRTVVGGIKFAALEFAGFTEMPYPSKAWAEGAGLAISAFAPIYDILAKSKDGWLTSGGPTVEEFSKAIMVTVQGIVAAAKFFGSPDNTGVFDTKKIPSKTWGENVGKAIEAFAPALAFITKNKGWFSAADPELISKAILATSYAIRDSSKIIKDGDYEGGVKKEWVTGTSEAVKGFTELAFWINERDGIDSATKWLIIIAKKVRDTANILAEGEYEKTVTSKWMSQVESSVLRYIALALIVSKTEGLEDEFVAPSISLTGVSLGGYKTGALGKLAGVVRSMLDTSKVFKEISNNMSNVDENWMTNVSDNVHYYVDLAKWLSTSDADTGFVTNAVNGMKLLSIGYSALATAVQNLSNSLEELDVEKLTALKNLNASVVLVSMMDPDQFSSMMDELEDRGGVLLDALQGVQEGEEPPNQGGSSATVKTPGGADGGEKTASKSMSDLYSIMEQVNEKLGTIASSSDKISKYVDEIRGDSPIKKSSWFS